MGTTDDIIKSLEKLGLKKNNAHIFVILMKLWTCNLSKITKNSKLAKTSIYNALKELADLGLITKVQINWSPSYTTRWVPGLEKLIKGEIRGAHRKNEILHSLAPDLETLATSNFQDPNIHMFIWKHWIEQALEDSLSSSETILSYINFDDLNKYFIDIHESYIKKRKAKKLQKMILAIKTPSSLKYATKYDQDVTKIRFLKSKWIWHMGVNIYDSKVVFITHRELQPVAIIIEDSQVYKFQKTLFLELWERG